MEEFMTDLANDDLLDDEAQEIEDAMQDVLDNDSRDIDDIAEITDEDIEASDYDPYEGEDELADDDYVKPVADDNPDEILYFAADSEDEDEEDE